MNQGTEHDIRIQAYPGQVILSGGKVTIVLQPNMAREMAVRLLEAADVAEQARPRLDCTTLVSGGNA